MVDAYSAAVGGEGSCWLVGEVVVPDPRSECEQSESDAGAEAGQGAGAVAFEAELAFAGPKGRFDPLADGAEAAVAGGFVLAVGAQEPGAGSGHQGFEVATGEVLVGDHGVAGDGDAFEHFGGDDAFAEVGRGEFPADRHPVARADQIQPEPPKPAAVAGAAAVAGMSGERRAACRLA